MKLTTCKLSNRELPFDEKDGLQSFCVPILSQMDEGIRSEYARYQVLELIIGLLQRHYVTVGGRCGSAKRWDR